MDVVDDVLLDRDRSKAFKERTHKTPNTNKRVDRVRIVIVLPLLHLLLLLLLMLRRLFVVVAVGFFLTWLSGGGCNVIVDNVIVDNVVRVWVCVCVCVRANDFGFCWYRKRFGKMAKRIRERERRDTGNLDFLLMTV